MRVLVAALYTKGDVKEGGSSFFMKCIVDTMKEMGHSVTVAGLLSDKGSFEAAITQEYDLVICSHREVLSKLGSISAIKVCISQGLVESETFVKGADLYYSISEEAKINNRDNFGIDSDILPQPITFPKASPPSINSELKNILIIRRYPLVNPEPFQVLFDKYCVRISDQGKPIEGQIEWADLCVTLGRGALEAMARGRTVLVADKRHYMGPLGDGYLNKDSLAEILKNNISGRRYRYEITDEWLLEEVAKYDPSDSFFLRNHIRVSNEAHLVVSKIIRDAYPYLLDKNVDLSSFLDYRRDKDV